MTETDTSRDVVEKIAGQFERRAERKAAKHAVNSRYAKPDDRFNEIPSVLRALLARAEKAEAACDEWAEVSQANYQRAKKAEAVLNRALDQINSLDKEISRYAAQVQSLDAECDRRHAALTAALAEAEARGRNEALREIVGYHLEQYKKNKAEAVAYRSDGVTDGSIEACLSEAILHRESADYVSALIDTEATACDAKSPETEPQPDLSGTSEPQGASGVTMQEAQDGET